ncbi:SpvB/TcaC N-terminal domain-containing protein [Luteibacter sp.]|uniref:SpvB/TcaC N-terminal domain-containing protein n=1 Tax=Luteibacter sp. TaxID=1886636 RepID=UPI002809031F|nr:SpvB/TcaC N-terminal domain-containing protein [Luteibacter sp.]MDQ8050433.1 SpvB/TcaC N-terminal domain-containing protein [Luteibacter sp.]
MNARLGVIEPESLTAPVVSPPIGTDWEDPDIRGAVSFEIPLPLPAARGAPILRFSYVSTCASGPFGVGWSLNMLPIARRPGGTALRFDDTDNFCGPDGSPILPWDETSVTSFRGDALPMPFRVRQFLPRVEGAFRRIEHWQAEGAHDFWLVHDADGTLHVYGAHADARLSDPADPERIAEWRVQESLSPHGARTVYEYAREDGVGHPDDGRDSTSARYLSRIRYGNRHPGANLLVWETATLPDDDWHFDCIFDYGARDTGPSSCPSYEPGAPWPARPDPVCDVAYGFEHRQLRLCRQILAFHRFPLLGANPVLVHRLLLDYTATPRYCLLQRVTRLAYDEHEKCHALPPLTLTWNEPDASLGQTCIFDCPSPMDRTSDIRLIDLYGGGLPGLLWQSTVGWLYAEPYRNPGEADGIVYGPAVALPMPSTGKPGTSLLEFVGSSPWRFVDASCDGRLEWMLNTDTVKGTNRIGSNKQWTRFTSCTSMPTEYVPSFAHEVDIDGSGRRAMVIVERHALRIFARNAAGDFLPPRTETHLADALPTGSDPREWKAFAALLVPGANDLVTVDVHGAVVAWADRGHGRLAARRAVCQLDVGENLDPARLFVVDVDGDGLADILYASRRGLLIFFNRSGHGFDQALIRAWPDGYRLDDTWHFETGDFAGRGGFSLLIQAPGVAGNRPTRWRMDIGLPFPLRLATTDNHQGALTRVDWRSSAQEALDGAHQGLCPIDRLPYAIPVAKRITLTDEIAGRSCYREYAYRDGHHDAVENICRGFQRIDTLTVPGDDSIAANLQRCWYHVGDASVDDGRTGFNDTAPGAIPLAEVRFTQWLGSDDRDDPLQNPEDANELRHALIGSLRRRETYECDNGGENTLLIALTEVRHQVRRVVAAGEAAPFGCSLPLMLEDANEDRSGWESDPRREHGLYLDHDAFGIARRTIRVACSREMGCPPDDDESRRLWADSHDEQQHVQTVVETHIMPWHSSDRQAWRLGLAGDWRVDRMILSNVALPTATIRAERFEGESDPTLHGTRALVALSSTEYVSADGQALPDLNGLVACVMVASIDAEAQTGYRLALGDDRFATMADHAGHIPMRSRLMSPSEGLLGEELELREYDGRDHFFRVRRDSPARSIGWTSYRYDASDLFVISASDPVGWNVRFDIDYRRLRPWRTTDANGVVRSIAMDAFGSLRRGTIHGKQRDSAGVVSDTGFGQISPITPLPASTVGESVDDPGSAVGNHGFAWVANENAWDTERQPTHALKIVADRYPTDAARQFHRSIVHFDGFGRLIREVHATSSTATAWSVRRQFHWITDGPIAASSLPYGTQDWLYRAIPPDVGATRFAWDARARLTATTDAEGRTKRTWRFSWYTVDEDENRVAAKQNLADPLPSSPQMVSFDAGGTAIRFTRYLAGSTSDVTEPCIERTLLHLDGQPVSVVDARSFPQGQAVRTYATGLGAGHVWSADAGDVWSLINDAGNLVWRRDATGVDHEWTYDAAGRLTTTDVATGTSRRTITRVAYRDPESSPSGDNLASLATCTYDTGGRIDIVRASLLGRPLTRSRRLLKAGVLANWIDNDTIDDALEAEASVTHMDCDALGAPVSITHSAGYRQEASWAADRTMKELRVFTTGDAPVAVVGYDSRDAAGRALQVHFGSMTRALEYEAATGRLISESTATGAGGVLHETRITRDRVGNIIALDLGDDDQRHYRYDGGYRLVEASGRESVTSPVDGALPPLILGPVLPSLTVGYTQRFEYDASDNVVNVEHRRDDGRLRSESTVVAALSNRGLPAATGAVPGDVDQWFDAAGRLSVLWPGKRRLLWDTEGRLHELGSVSDPDGHEVSTYGGDGMRLRKTWWRPDGTGEIRYDGALAQQSGSLGETDVLEVPAEGVVLRMRVHQGSPAVSYELDTTSRPASYVVDDSGTMLTSEEYHPYGTSALRAARAEADEAAKNVRYSGKERESWGGQDFGHRFYEAWQWRWMSPDPAADAAGLNRYAMVHGNPVTHEDVDGLMTPEERLVRDQDERGMRTPGADIARARRLFLDDAARYVSARLREGQTGEQALQRGAAYAGFFIPVTRTFSLQAVSHALETHADTLQVSLQNNRVVGIAQNGFVNPVAPVYGDGPFPGTTPLTHGEIRGSNVSFNIAEQHLQGGTARTASQFAITDFDAYIGGINRAFRRSASDSRAIRREPHASPAELHQWTIENIRQHLAPHTAPRDQGDVTVEVRPMRRVDGIGGAHAEVQAINQANRILASRLAFNDIPERVIVFTVKLRPSIQLGRAASTGQIDRKLLPFVACYHCDGILSGAPVPHGAIARVQTGRSNNSGYLPERPASQNRPDNERRHRRPDYRSDAESNYASSGSSRSSSVSSRSSRSSSVSSRNSGSSHHTSESGRSSRGESRQDRSRSPRGRPSELAQRHPILYRALTTDMPPPGHRPPRSPVQGNRTPRSPPHRPGTSRQLEF